MLLSVDVQGFQYSPSPVVPFYFSRLGCFPVHLVLVCPGVDCNSILGVMLLHCILVLTQSLLKGSTCLSNVNTFTILAWYFINDTFLLLVFSGLLNSSYYEQVEGAAMGSPLSPIVANIFMEDLETQALETAAWKPKMWRRYVDDVLVVWPHGDQLLQEFHQHLNK